MVILALNAATEVLSVAVCSPDSLVRERFLEGPTIKAENLIPHIQEILAEGKLTLKDLTAVALAIGPGAFTGLRLSLVTAKTICLELEIPLTPISTLAALAYQYRDRAQGKKLRIVLKACRGDVTTALFAPDGSRLEEDHPLKAESIPQNPDEVVLFDPVPEAAALAEIGFREKTQFDREAILALTPRYSHESRINFSSKPELQHLKIGIHEEARLSQ
jgi:tRNA threonylcarbamoyl adenosine modification protein YeaZ